MTVTQFVKKYNLYYDAKVFEEHIITTLGSGNKQFVIKSPYCELDEEVLDWNTQEYILNECLPRVYTYVNQRWFDVKKGYVTTFERIWFQGVLAQHLTNKDINNFRKGVGAFVDVLKEIFGEKFFEDLCEVTEPKIDTLDESRIIYKFPAPSLN